jgi:hypothetical protein
MRSWIVWLTDRRNGRRAEWPFKGEHAKKNKRRMYKASQSISRPTSFIHSAITFCFHFYSIIPVCLPALPLIEKRKTNGKCGLSVGWNGKKRKKGHQIKMGECVLF